MTEFTSQTQAKRFFVERILAEAQREGHPLSENEQWMLRFSESDPDFVVDPARVEALGNEISDDAYERKVAALAQRACEADIAADASASSGILQPVLSKWVPPWWAFWR